MVGVVAQVVEQRTENPCVGGSTPPDATKKGWFFCQPFFITYPFSSFTLTNVYFQNILE